MLQKAIEIDGNVYNITLLKGWDAYDEWCKVSPLFVPLAGIIGDEVINHTDGYETSVMTSLAATIAHGMANPEVREVSRKLLETVYKGSKKIDVNEEFAGNFKGLMNLILFAFAENFMDFILGLLKKLDIEISSWADLKEILAGMFTKPLEESNEDAQ